MTTDYRDLIAENYQGQARYRALQMVLTYLSWVRSLELADEVTVKVRRRS